MKKEYRKFTIKQAAGDDDYAMMREMLRRRLRGLSSGDEQESPTAPSAPDLLLIDGGAGQLSAALEVLEEMGLRDKIPLAAIAKGPDRNAGRERFFMPPLPHLSHGEAKMKEFSLPPDDPVLHYLQRLRDEAHRHAIGAHRAKRSAALRRSELDTLPGIGAKRKKALLHHFGSARAVADASREELAQAEGISAKIADAIWRHFHG